MSEQCLIKQKISIARNSQKEQNENPEVEKYNDWSEIFTRGNP